VKPADEYRVVRDVQAASTYSFANPGIVGHSSEGPGVGATGTTTARSAVVGGVMRIVQAF
jgi:hypothetical protein